MNTVVSFDWGRHAITVAFADYNTAHYFSWGNADTIKGAKEHMRRELRRGDGCGIVLSEVLEVGRFR